MVLLYSDPTRRKKKKKTNKLNVKKLNSCFLRVYNCRDNNLQLDENGNIHPYTVPVLAGGHMQIHRELSKQIEYRERSE